MALATVYPKIGEQGGRPPMPLERMLRTYFLQRWFNVSDPAVEGELYDSAAMRSFVGIDLGAEVAPDETTICKFCHLLEKNKLGKILLRAVNEHLRRNGSKIANASQIANTLVPANWPIRLGELTETEEVPPVCPIQDYERIQGLRKTEIKQNTCTKNE